MGIMKITTIAIAIIAFGWWWSDNQSKKDDFARACVGAGGTFTPQFLAADSYCDVK
jgi:hypothetical protein